MEFNLENLGLKNTNLFDPLNDTIEALPEVKGLYMIIGRNIESIQSIFVDIEMPTVNGYPVIYWNFCETRT